MRIYKSVVIFMIGVCLTCLLFGCQPLPHNIRLIVPKGYRGVFEFKFGGSKHGEVLQIGNELVCRVPADGTLNVMDSRPFEAWHSYSAQYDNGDFLPYAYDEDEAAKNIVYCFTLYSTQEGLYFFVGTVEEEKAAIEVKGVKGIEDVHVVN